tara:strand:- start:1127 stop:2071 length:945 start_codon:yes stop_codon:yes gene_type:complete
MRSDLLTLNIHYDVIEHFIPMDDFLKMSDSVQKIIDNLNKEILGGALTYQLVLLPPEAGSFLKTVGLLTLASVVSNGVVFPLVGDYTQGVFEALTGHSPAYYGKKNTAALLIDLTVGFFSKEIEELERCIPREINIDRAYKAKTDFYRACQDNKDIKGIGFDRTDNFPIKRDSFKNHISKDRVRELNSDFIIYDAVLISPVTEDKKLQWDFEEVSSGQKISAYMHDESFKNGVLKGQYPIKQTNKSDILQILVEYKKQERNGVIEKKETTVETVFKFNSQVILSLPADLPMGTKFQLPSRTPMDDLWGGEMPML